MGIGQGSKREGSKVNLEGRNVGENVLGKVSFSFYLMGLALSHKIVHPELPRLPVRENLSKLI